MTSVSTKSLYNQTSNWHEQAVLIINMWFNLIKVVKTHSWKIVHGKLGYLNKIKIFWERECSCLLWWLEIYCVYKGLFTRFWSVILIQSYPFALYHSQVSSPLSSHGIIILSMLTWLVLHVAAVTLLHPVLNKSKLTLINWN